MTKIILVRHGQTEWNRIERFRGRADVPLNPTGRAQAELTGKKVAATWRPVAIYSSPLSRALETAEAISHQVRVMQGISLQVKVHPGLMDIDYGEWQGLTPEETHQRWPEALDDWYNAPQRAAIPGGESLDSLRERGMAVVMELASLYAGKIILLLGHTVINRVLLLAILGLGNERFWRLKQDTCAINVFEAENGIYTLESLNDTCHLQGELFAV
jgi:broad specificity phosphatase PhoE